jgi:hypothetical protein
LAQTHTNIASVIRGGRLNSLMILLWCQVMHGFTLPYSVPQQFLTTSSSLR